MLPMMLAKKILDLDEAELTKLLREFEMQNRDAYEELKAKIEDL